MAVIGDYPVQACYVPMSPPWLPRWDSPWWTYPTYLSPDRPAFVETETTVTIRRVYRTPYRLGRYSAWEKN